MLVLSIANKVISSAARFDLCSSPCPRARRWPRGVAAAGRALGSRHGCQESTSSFAGSSRKAEAPTSACEAVGNGYQRASKYSLGRGKSSFQRAWFPAGRPGVDQALGRAGFPCTEMGVRAGVQLCAGGVRRVMGCSSSRRIPLTSAPSLLCSLPAGILQVVPRGPAVCKVPLAQPFGEPGSPRVPLRQQLLQGGAGPPLGRLHA